MNSRYISDEERAIAISMGEDDPELAKRVAAVLACRCVC